MNPVKTPQIDAVLSGVFSRLKADYLTRVWNKYNEHNAKVSSEVSSMVHIPSKCGFSHDSDHILKKNIFFFLLCSRCEWEAFLLICDYKL